jgi:hypothetical protein
MTTAGGLKKVNGVKDRTMKLATDDVDYMVTVITYSLGVLAAHTACQHKAENGLIPSQDELLVAHRLLDEVPINLVKVLDYLLALHENFELNDAQTEIVDFWLQRTNELRRSKADDS